MSLYDTDHYSISPKQGPQGRRTDSSKSEDSTLKTLLRSTSLRSISAKRSNNKDDIASLGLTLVGMCLQSGQKEDPSIIEKHLPEPAAPGYSSQLNRALPIDYQFLTFDKNQPPSDDIIETCFQHFLKKSAFTKEAIQNLNASPLTRKWALLCQDQNASRNIRSVSSSTDYSAKWYASHISNLSIKDLHKLERLLRSKDFVEEFLALDGHLCLLDCLKYNNDEEREFLVLRSFKNLINSKKGTDMIVQNFDILMFFIRTLINTAKIVNKSIVTDILVLLSYWSEPLGRNNILKVFNKLSNLSLFDTWIHCLIELTGEDCLVFTNALLKDLCLSSMFLILSICEGSESSNDKRIILLKFKEAGIYPLFHKMKLIEDKIIDEQIQKYKEVEQSALSADIMREIDLSDSQIDVVFKLVKKKIGTNTELEQSIYLILSTIDDFLSRSTLSESSKLLKLTTSILAQINRDSLYLNGNSESVLNVAIQKFMDRLSTDDIARRAMVEVKEYETKTTDLSNEVTKLKAALEVSHGDLLKIIESQGQEIKKKDEIIKESKIKMDEMDKIRASERSKYEKERAKIALTNEPLPSHEIHYQDSSLYREKLLESLSVRTKQLEEYEWQKSKHKKAKAKKNSSLSRTKSSLVLSSLSLVLLDSNSKYESSVSGMLSHDESPDSIRQGEQGSAGSAFSQSVNSTGSLDSSRLASSTVGASMIATVIVPKYQHSVSGLSSSGTVTPQVSSSDPSVILNSPQCTPANLTLLPIANTAKGSSLSSLQPSPPPMPDFLERQVKSAPVDSGPPPPPPPPPPPLPSDLFKPKPSSAPALTPSVNETLPSCPPAPPAPPAPLLPPSSAAAAAPAPPPLPEFLSKVEATKERDPNKINTTIPTPPPLPDSLILKPKSLPDLKNPVTSLLPKSKIDEISKSLYRPSKKMKQLHWDKVDQIQETIWDHASDSKVDELMELGVLKEVEDLFTVKEISKKAQPSTTIKTDKITFLPRDLSQQFGINLHMFSNLTEMELVSKVLRCDHIIMDNISALEFFNKDELCQIPNTLLKSFKPYCTDWINNRKPEKDPSVLDRYDRVFLELCFNLRHYWRSRSRALLLLKTFEKDYHDLISKLQNVDETIQSIKNSKNLKNIFILIKEIGNYMNRKQVNGFKLASLQKLNFIKDQNQKTFLHYLETVVRKAYPEYLSFLQDLELTQHSAKINVEQLSTDIRAYIQSMKNVENSVNIGNLSDPKTLHPGDWVLRKIIPRLPDAKKKCQLLEDQHILVMKDFDRLMQYFGENPKDSSARTNFLTKFHDFAKDFERVEKENLDEEEKQRVYEKRKEKMILSQKEKSKETLDSADSEGVVDNLLKKLKVVSTEKRRTSVVSVTSRSRAKDHDDAKLINRAQTLLEGTKNIT